MFYQKGGYTARPCSFQLLFNLLGLFLGSGFLSVGALTAFLHGVGHGGSDQADGANRVVVRGDDVVDLVRVAVGVDDGDDRDVQLAGLSDGVVLLAGVND